MFDQLYDIARILEKGMLVGNSEILPGLLINRIGYIIPPSR